MDDRYLGDVFEECEDIHAVLSAVLDADPDDVDVMIHLATLRIRELTS